MSISAFLEQLARTRTERNYHYRFYQGFNFKYNPETTQDRVLRIEVRSPGAIYTTAVIRALHAAPPHGMPQAAVWWAFYRPKGCKELPHPCDIADALGLTNEESGKIVRAGEEIVVFNDDGTTYARYSKQLRCDMLAACGLEEHPEHQELF